MKEDSMGLKRQNALLKSTDNVEQERLLNYFRKKFIYLKFY